MFSPSPAFICSFVSGSYDRNVPCGACVKRGAAASCSAAPTKRKKPTVDPAQDLSHRQSAALAELSLFRTTLDSLRARLPGLEHFIANAQLKEEDSAELDEVIKAFGDPVTELTALRDEEGDLPSSSRNGGTSTHGRRASDSAPANESGVGPRASTSAAGADAGTSKNGAEPPRKKVRLSEPKREEDQSGSNVQAAVNLEFYTLGRPRTWAEQEKLPPADDDAPPSSPSHQLAILPPETQVESPMSRFPDGPSLQAVDPGPLAESVLLEVGLDLFGFHHAVVHGPTFRGQLAAFRSLGEDAFSRASPAWLSLYFAILAVSAKLVSREKTEEMGWSDERMFKAASDWFECCVACLYRSNFLQVHDFFTLQAIALLVLSGRDAGSATLIATLLYSGISIAQDMGLHRLPSDEQWDLALKGKPARIRAKSLVDREIRKRVVWALVHSEYFAIPFKGYSTLAKVQIATPLPLNATDEDLATGELIDRPASEFTVVSWLLCYVDMGSLMARAFEHSTSEKATAAQAYHAFLEADKQLEALLNDRPAWLRKGEDAGDLPGDLADTIRSTYLISLQHKILSIHRPFLAKPSRATTYAFSRRRVIEAARAILREAPLVQTNRIWTCIYHVSVALFSLTLELYEQLKQASPDNDAIREEIQAALPTLEGLKDVSAIAERGLGLVLPLLADEERMRIEGAQVKEKRKGKSTAASRKAASTASSTAPSTALPSPTLPSLTGSPTLSAAAGPSSSTPFANPFVPSASPDPAGINTYPFGSAFTGYDPSAAAAAGPGGIPHPYGGYPLPPWLYGEQFLHLQLGGLDGSTSSGGATPTTAAAAAAGGSSSATGIPSAASFAPYAAYGLPPMPSAGAATQGLPSPWGMPHAMGMGMGGPYRAALGWDWTGMMPPFAGAPVGETGEGGGQGQGGEGEGAQ
ncbi:hypothetical protein JCM6882_000367 [Rhodosporidiobolus microsporus]